MIKIIQIIHFAGSAAVMLHALTRLSLIQQGKRPPLDRSIISFSVVMSALSFFIAGYAIALADWFNIVANLVCAFLWIAYARLAFTIMRKKRNDNSTPA